MEQEDIGLKLPALLTLRVLSPKEEHLRFQGILNNLESALTFQLTELRKLRDDNIACFETTKQVVDLRIMICEIQEQDSRLLVFGEGPTSEAERDRNLLILKEAIRKRDLYTRCLPNLFGDPILSMEVPKGLAFAKRVIDLGLRRARFLSEADYRYARELVSQE